jgi:hypothetical protein
LLHQERIYRVGAAPYFDAPSGPDTPNSHHVTSLRETKVVHGDEDKAIYVAVADWSNHLRWVHVARRAQRIEHTINAHERANQHRPWCAGVGMWAFCYRSSMYNYQNYHDSVTTDCEPCVI